MMSYISFFGSAWKLVSENVKEISNFDDGEGGGGLCPGGSLSGEPPQTETPYGKERVVRTLLECILVSFCGFSGGSDVLYTNK